MFPEVLLEQNLIFLELHLLYPLVYEKLLRNSNLHVKMVGDQCAKNNPLCYSAGIYFLKVNNGGTRTMCEIYSKLTPTTLSML